MSILLSAYYPEGIVFVADKNATLTWESFEGERRHVEPTSTKVLSWPNHRAVVGFVGLGQLAGYKMDEWMRIFIAGSYDFDDIYELAEELRSRLQADFYKDFPEGADVSKCQMIVHLGGYTVKEGTAVPLMLHIFNHGGLDERTGIYTDGRREFRLSEDVEKGFKSWPNPQDYPTRVRDRLQGMINERRYLWFNNGANLGAFLVFRDFVWQALHVIQDHHFSPKFEGLWSRLAFCKMVVEVFGAYFTHHYDPNERIVGGGVDAVYVPWPEVPMPSN